MRYCCFLLLLCFTSCVKYLDKKSDATLAIPKSLDDLHGLFNDNLYITTGITPGDGTVAADEYFITDDRFNSLNDNFKDAYFWRPQKYPSGDWADAYKAVFNSNFCLENLPSIPRNNANAAKYDQVQGTAYFFRAFTFLNLVWQYGKAYDPNTAQTDLGIVLKESTNINEKSVRASVRECYDKVISDAHNALRLLPQSVVHVVQPTRAAAAAVLARAFLSMKVYDSAGYYANLCLQEESELLDFNTINVDRNPMRYGRYDNPEIIFYSEGFSGLAASSSAYVDSNLYALFVPGDLRLRAWFAQRGNWYYYKGSYTERANHFSGLATDEMYLVRAESHARAGRINEAMDDLNHLLRHRWDGSFVPLTASTAGEALQLILTERRKELLFRLLRFMDIKRLNTEGAGISVRRLVNGQLYELPPNDPRFALPIPRQIIEVTGMPQN